MQFTVNTTQLASVIGLIITIVGVIGSAVKILMRFKKLEEHNEKNANLIKELARAQFATLDGLKQLGCNGEVTKAHLKLRDEIINN